jgi:hypothetical protein
LSLIAKIVVGLEMRNGYRNFVGKPDASLRMDLKVIVSVKWIHLPQDRYL